MVVRSFLEDRLLNGTLVVIWSFNDRLAIGLFFNKFRSFYGVWVVIWLFTLGEEIM